MKCGAGGLAGWSPQWPWSVSYTHLVMLQVLMHSQIAAEENRFTIEDVVDMLAKKLVRRHPHVFGDQKALTAEEGLASWEAVKRMEKEERERRKSGGSASRAGCEKI